MEKWRTILLLLWPSPLAHWSIYDERKNKRASGLRREKKKKICALNEWKINKNKKNVSLGKWRYWSCCCEFKLLEVFKDCISYLLYVCAHTAQSGVVFTQRWAMWSAVASPEVETVPLWQTSWRPVGSACVIALCTELYLCIEFYLFLNSPLFLSTMTIIFFGFDTFSLDRDGSRANVSQLL